MAVRCRERKSSIRLLGTLIQGAPRSFHPLRSWAIGSESSRKAELSLDGLSDFFLVLGLVRAFIRSFVRIYFSHDYLLLLSVIRNIVEYIVDISVQLTETWSSDWETASCRRDACRPPDNKHAKRTFSETRGLKKKRKDDLLLFASYLQGGHRVFRLPCGDDAQFYLLHDKC